MRVNLQATEPEESLPDTDTTIVEKNSKKGKRQRDDTMNMKTPQQQQKKKKFRPKVVKEGKAKRPPSKLGTKKESVSRRTKSKKDLPLNKEEVAETSEFRINTRPKRSSRRALRFDFDTIQEKDEYFVNGSTPGGEVPALFSNIPKRMFSNIPKRRRSNRKSKNSGNARTGGEVPVLFSNIPKRMFSNIPKRRRSRRKSNNSGNAGNVLNISNDQEDMSRTKLSSLVEEIIKDDLTKKKNMITYDQRVTDGDLLRNKSNTSDSHISQCLVDLNNHEKLRRKRSNIVRRPRNLQSLSGFIVVPINSERQGDWLKSIVSKMQKKKRSKRNSLTSQLNSRILQLQWEAVLPGNSTGKSLDEKRALKDFIELFKKLDINRENLSISRNKQTALILYKTTHQERKPMQPKVKLDDETTRVWKLLTLSMDSEGINGIDEEKQKWWKEERNMFQRRTSSFIACMRLVQGDRSFSPWKGSVVDSVIGVFLTQNVADHSSSSAFMDIAAAFPINLNSSKGLYNDEGESSNVVAIPQLHHPTCIIHEIDDEEEEENNIFTKNDLSTENKTFDSEMKGRMQRSNKKSNKKTGIDWDSLRREVESNGQKKERTERNMDAADWDAMRCADRSKIADIIRQRGMNHMLSARMQAFLNRLVQEHGSIDLEWLRDVHPDKAKEYLLSIDGLGLKSVECVRLLSLHQMAFPVDTNVGRIAVRLGWVPLQPLPEEFEIHRLELYPDLASVQKYLWPRLCKLDQKTLYELHYHMITFGKVFCTKQKPNCNACPLRSECRHYASACASARLSLPEPQESRIVTADDKRCNPEPVVVNFQQSLFLNQDREQAQRTQTLEIYSSEVNCEPIIEEPATPEPEVLENDIEDFPWGNNDDEILRIWLNKEPTTQNSEKNLQLQEVGTSKDLVPLSPQAAKRPMQKLKNKTRLRTEHYVYELPASHPLVQELEKREPDDPCPYLLAIWTPGETANSIQPPGKSCAAQESNTLCHEKTCFSCNSAREDKSKTVRGTLLIPCKTAMRSRFPLNGTYFQNNEVFADHESSINPIDVPRDSIWNLRRRIVYFGSSVSSIVKGLAVDAIQDCFWRGYVCVRGFDRKSRTPRPLSKRLHCQPSRQNKDEE